MPLPLPHHLPATQCTSLRPLTVSAATSTAKQVITLYLQAAGQLKDTSRKKYLATQLQFLDYCERNDLPWHTDYVRFWVTELAVTKDKTLAPKTLLQKVSHINMLTELRPALIDGPAVTATNQLKGSGVCYIPGVRNTILPPSFLLTLAQLEEPQLIHLAIQMQTMLGLRGGMMVLIIRAHLLTPGRLVVPPYKHTKHTTVVPTDQIPQWLLTAFLSYAKNDLTPILPWAGAQQS